MTQSCPSLVVAATAVALMSGVPSFAMAQSTLAIADNEGIFFDGQAFKITRGKAEGDVRGLIKGSGARELRPSAVIFRSGGKLYIVDSPLALGRNGAAGSLILGAETEQPNRVHIEYDPPQNPDHQMLYDRIRENRVLETVQQILSPFRLPTELRIKTMGCDGMVNAWYSTDDGKPTVHLCYETAPEHPSEPAGGDHPGGSNAT